MRTAGNYFFNFISIQNLNIGHGLHLEKKLIACPFRGISGAAFFSSQHGIANSYMLKNFTNIAGYFLCTFIKATGTTYPKQNFRSFTFSGHFGHGWYVQFVHYSIYQSDRLIINSSDFFECGVFDY